MAKCRESTPGRFRLDAARGHGLGHGDRASALSYAALALIRVEPGLGSFTVPHGRLPSAARPSATATARPAPSKRVEARLAARRGPRGVNFVTGVGGAYDDPRKHGNSWER